MLKKIGMLLAACLLLAQCASLQGISGESAKKEYRSIWVDSWNESFLTKKQAEHLVKTCRETNINTIMIEIRKVGDAYYDSSIEPRATNIKEDENYDPLAYLMRLAHDTSDGQKYIHVHGWFVMHRIHKTNLPLSPDHVLSRHPEYIMTNRAGENEVSKNQYLDPGHPGTVDHNVAVIVDCLEKYPLDGVNLDYIRYPEYEGGWGYNPKSIERFNDFYGRTGIPEDDDPAWQSWRRECVTNEVKKVYVKSIKQAPNVIVSTDTVNWGMEFDDYENSDPYSKVYQDWAGWLDEGIIDYNALMNYSRTMARYQGWTKLSLQHDDKRGSIIGAGVYLQKSIDASIEQLLYARKQGAAGLNIYDWSSEVNASTLNETPEDFYRRVKEEVFQEWADVPEPEWRKDITIGVLEGTITSEDMPLDHVKVSIAKEEYETFTDGSGWFAMIDLPVGCHSLTLSKKGYQDKTAIVHVKPQQGTEYIFTMKK